VTLPGIENDPEICGGEARVAGTRIPVWLLVQARKTGMSEVAILQAYPGLRVEDLVTAWTYYEARQAEIERQILDNETA
jgi:uncharacterized protein (DUF433 family)